MAECLKSKLKIADNGDYRFCPYCGDEISTSDQLQMLSTESMHLFSKKLGVASNIWAISAFLIITLVFAIFSFIKQPSILPTLLMMMCIFFVVRIHTKHQELKTIKSAIAENARKTALLKK